MQIQGHLYKGLKQPCVWVSRGQGPWKQFFMNTEKWLCVIFLISFEPACHPPCPHSPLNHNFGIYSEAVENFKKTF